MKVKHTPEPWAVSDSPKGLIVSNSTDDWRKKWCLSTVDTGRRYPDSFSLENARRIVACVNACAGISTEDLIDGKFVIK